MIALYFAVFLISFFSSAMATFRTEDTSAPPPLPPPIPCSSYTELSDAWRRINYVRHQNYLNCDKPDSIVSTNLAWGSWFRFTGAAGTKLPTAPAPVERRQGQDGGEQICGTRGVAYISSGGNPTLQDGVVTRDVCFETRLWTAVSNICEFKTTVRVAACRDIHGDFFVYQLPAVPSCSLAYCAIE